MRLGISTRIHASERFITRTTVALCSVSLLCLGIVFLRKPNPLLADAARIVGLCPRLPRAGKIDCLAGGSPVLPLGSCDLPPNQGISRDWILLPSV